MSQDTLENDKEDTKIYVTVNGKTYTNALPFNGKFHLVSVYHPFKTVHAKRLNG